MIWRGIFALLINRSEKVINLRLMTSGLDSSPCHSSPSSFPNILRDRSTILLAVSSNQFRAFLRPLLQSLRTYSIEGIIAEGIETEEEMQVVKEMGVFIIQGFLLGRPEEIKKGGEGKKSLNSGE